MNKKDLAGFLGVALLFSSGVCPLPAEAALTAVWANEGGDKVTQDELRATLHPGTALNSVWDGTGLKLFGARNEVVGFNLILEAAGGARVVSVSISPLRGPGGSTIASVPASGDQVFSYVNRNIELFYVRYLPIKGLSLSSYDGYDERHVPKRLRRPWSGDGIGSGVWQDRPDHDKFYPEIALPLELVPAFNIAIGQNQSIWGDIYIPKSAPAGVFIGTITVQEAGFAARSIPVQLRVRDFALPDMPSARTMLSFSSANIHKRFFGAGYVHPNSAAGVAAKSVRDRYFMLAHRHRMSLIGDNADNCSLTGDQPCPEWLPRLDGSLFTAANGYDGPGVNTGNNVYAIGAYGAWNWKNEGEVGMHRHADAWVAWFSRNAPTTEYFLFLADESPNTAQTEMWAQWILSNPGPGRQLKSFASNQLPLAASRIPSLDIPGSTLIVGDPQVWQPLADRYQSDPRKRFFMYNAHRPATGSTATEDDGVALRELAWVQYKKRISRWWMWESTHYNNFQGGMGETNVFRTAQTFGIRSRVDPVMGETGWNYNNGDGVLFYPGTDRIYPQENYQRNGAFASLRLKMWRRGLQDVDYLQIASAINPAAVQTLVSTMAPRALWEYGVADPGDPSWVRSDISWPIDPDAWEAARKQLADIIAPLPGDTTPPSPPPKLFFYYPTTTEIRLYWSAASDNAGVAGYRLDVSTNAAFAGALPGYNNRNMGSALSASLAGLQPGTTHYARARAYDAGGNVSSSTAIAALATLNADFAALSAPVNVVMSSATSSTLFLSWSPSTSTASLQVLNYQVQVSTLADFSNFAGAPWGGSFHYVPARTAVLSGLQPGRLYHVRIRANDVYGNASRYAAASAATGGMISVVSLATDPAFSPRVYPNPWRGDRDPGANITFDQMPANCTVKIFTVSAHAVKTLNAPGGSVAWDLTNNSGDRVASGLYFYLITTEGNRTSRGTLAIIR